MLLCALIYATATITTATTVQADISNVDKVAIHLHKKGYLFTLPFSYTMSNFRLGLKRWQQDKNLTVNGRITTEVLDYIDYEHIKEPIVSYLVTNNLLNQYDQENDEKVTEAIKLLQKNSGSLNETGKANQETLNYILNKRLIW